MWPITRNLLYRANPYCLWTSLAIGMCSPVHWTGQWLLANVCFLTLSGASYFSKGLMWVLPIICLFALLKSPSFGAHDGCDTRLYWCHIGMRLSFWFWYWDHQVIKSQKLQDQVPGFALFSMRMGRQVWPIYPSTKSLMRNIKEFRCAGLNASKPWYFYHFSSFSTLFFFFKSGNSQILAKFTIPVFGCYSFSHKALSLLNKRGAMRQRLWLSESEATSVKAIFSWQIFMDLRTQLKAKTNFLILHEVVLVMGSKDACIWLLSRWTVWKWRDIPNFT